MNKRITSLLLCFVMVFVMLATAVPALAAPIESTQLKVIPDKTKASPGDIITYTIVMGPVSDMGSMQMVLDIPTGLTYVENSTTLAANLKTTLGFDLLDWTEVSKMINGGASAADYESATDTELAKFQCKVDDGATGSLEVGLTNLEFGSCQTFEYHTDRFSVVKTPVTITAAPKPATGISLNKDELTLTAGATETLVANVTPSDTTDTVAWSSDKPEVATVDSTGKVTAVAPGEAIITAKAGEKTATCTVKVSCAHTLETVPAKDSNCTEKGWDEYQKCTLCGALFDMSGGSIEGIPYRPLNDDHDFNMSEWGYKGADGLAHACTRNPAHKDGVVAHISGGAATETEDEVCTVCGYVITPATGHVCANHLTKVEAKAADCTNPGNKEHYKCSCGNLYEDAGALVPTDASKVTIAALGHNWNAATCTTPKTCDRCHITEGTALGHNWATEWGSNENKHWHDCSRCGDKKDEAAHTPDRAEATETDPIKCTVCDYVITPATGHVCANHLIKVEAKPADCTNPGNKEYYKCECGKFFEDAAALTEIIDHESVVIPALDHAWATEWSSDATNHWHACTRGDAKTDEAAHTPDRTEATETDPIKCTVCDYVIAPATGHVCANHLTKVEAKAADCTNPGNKMYYKCECGKFFEDADALTEIIDHESVVIPALDLDWAGEWSSDATNHWHACTRCDAKADEAAHTPDHPDGATFEYPVLCVECGYEMEAQREEGTIRVELPFKLTVNKTGEMDPGKEIFKFMAEEFGAPVEYELITSTLETNGAKTYEGVFIFTIKESDAGNLSEGFIFRQVKGDAEGWTYDETKFYAVPMFSESRDSIESWELYALDEEGRPDYENVLEEITFTNSYNAKKPVEPTEPSKPSTPDNNNPRTGNNSDLALWIVLLIASGSATGITIFSKKRKMNAK